jgi:hypothetical protein
MGDSVEPAPPGARPRSVRTFLAVVAALTAIAAAGCRADTPEPATSPTVDAVTAPVAFHVQLHAGQTLTLASPYAGCPGLSGTIRLSSERSVILSAYATSCSSGDTARPGNGRHGTYRTVADIPSDRRAGAVTFPTPLGEATAFNQPYFECTNSCHNYTEPVAVITLDHPSDPAYPALVAYGDKGQVNLDQLTTIVKTQLEP